MAEVDESRHPWEDLSRSSIERHLKGRPFDIEDVEFFHPSKKLRMEKSGEGEVIIIIS